MLIGELSKRSGFSKDTIRYYEKIKLIELAITSRTDSNYKDYPEEILDALKLIRKYKELGFTLEEIREIIVLRSIKVLNVTKLTELVELKLTCVESEIDKLHETKIRLTRELHALTLKKHGHTVDLPDMLLAA